MWTLDVLELKSSRNIWMIKLGCLGLSDWVVMGASRFLPVHQEESLLAGLLVNVDSKVSGLCALDLGTSYWRNLMTEGEKIFLQDNCSENGRVCWLGWAWVYAIGRLVFPDQLVSKVTLVQQFGSIWSGEPVQAGSSGCP